MKRSQLLIIAISCSLIITCYIAIFYLIRGTRYLFNSKTYQNEIVNNEIIERLIKYEYEWQDSNVHEDIITLDGDVIPASDLRRDAIIGNTAIVIFWPMCRIDEIINQP